VEYNRAISLLLGNLETAAVVVATHNAESVLKALETMKNHATDWNHPHINFAQLMGISDHLTLGLGKSIPRGQSREFTRYFFLTSEEPEKRE